MPAESQNQYSVYDFATNSEMLVSLIRDFAPISPVHT